MWMRSNVFGQRCSRPATAQDGIAQAIILLDNAPEDTIPTTTAFTLPPDDFTCSNVSRYTALQSILVSNTGLGPSEQNRSILFTDPSGTQRYIRYSH